VLSQAHRRSIHTSLTPVLGEEETDAFMSEFPASPNDVPLTKADLADFRAEIHDLFRQMAMWVAIAIITGMGISAGIAAGVAQAVGGG
jgi:hypothetical protein